MAFWYYHSTSQFWAYADESHRAQANKLREGNFLLTVAERAETLIALRRQPFSSMCSESCWVTMLLLRMHQSTGEQSVAPSEGRVPRTPSRLASRAL